MPDDSYLAELLNWRQRPGILSDADALRRLAQEMESALTRDVGDVQKAELRREILRVDVHRTALLGNPMSPANAFALGEAAERRVARARLADEPDGDAQD